MKKHMISRALALFMALSLLSTTAFAASFSQLQEAINDDFSNGTTAGEAIEGYEGRYGYAKNEETGTWGIEAWDTTGEDGTSTRNVLLNEDVTHENAAKDINSVEIKGSKTVVIDLNEQKIDGNGADTKNSGMLKINGADVTIQNGTLTGGNATNYGSAVRVLGGSSLTLDNVNVTGNKGTAGAVYASGSNITFAINGGSVSNNEGMGVRVNGTTTRGTITGTEEKNVEINNNGCGGVVLSGGSHIDITYADISGNTRQDEAAALQLSDRASATVSHVTMRDNHSLADGGAVQVKSPTGSLVMNDVIMTGNTAAGDGGAIRVSDGTVALTNVTMTDNTAGADGGVISASNGKVTLENVTMTGNKAAGNGGGVWIRSDSVLNLKGSNEIHDNISGAGKSDLYASGKGTTLNGISSSLKAPDGKQFDGWYETDDANEEKYETEGKTDRAMNLVVGLSDAPEMPGDNSNDGTTPDSTTPDAATTDFTGTGAADASATTIEDDEVPLAGLLTLADLLEELRQYEEIAEIELPEDFKWIDHEYAQAIYWGLQEELVVDTEDDPLDPDELLTVGLMREVLTNFVDIYAGLDDFAVELEGEDEDLVMDYVDMISRLAPFYEALEAALEAQAA